MKIRCECGAIYNVPESTCGKSVQCQRCGTTFVCPSPLPNPFAAADQQTTEKSVPGTFAHSPYAKSRTAQTSDAHQEAILKKYMSEETSLEDRLRQRREHSIETDRTSNSISFIVFGLCWIFAGVGVGALLFWMASATRIPIVLAFVYGLGGQYWLPPLLGLFGVYKIIIGIMSLFRVVDIESEKQLPSSW